MDLVHLGGLRSENRSHLEHFNLFFFLLQCKNGGGMARRYWKIPSESQGEKNEFPTSGEAASGEFNFFCRGMRREFSNTFEPYPSY